MLDIRDKKVTATEYQVTATSITATLPAYESGDELFAFVVTGSSTAPTGPGGTWAEWGTSVANGKRLSVWYKTAGSSESSPSWSVGSATYWEVAVFSIIGYSAVDSGGSARYNFTSQTAQNTSALGALSATSDDSLVFDVCMVASASMFPTVEDNSIYVDANETISTALGFFVGHRAVAAGSIPDINWRFDAARTGTILRITLTPAATGGVPVSANTLPRILRHYGMLDSYTFTDADTALSLGGAGINGIPVETTVPASELSTNLATATDFKAQSSRLTMATTYTLGTVKWNGPIDTFSTVQDCTGAVFDVHIASNFTASIIGPSGPIYIFGDDATPPNWVAYGFGSRSEVNTGGNYVAFSRRIAAGSTDFYAASDGTGAAMQWDRLKYAGPLIPRNATSGTTYIYLWKFSIISGCELVGGSADFPINHSRIREALASGEAIHDASLLQGTKQLVIEASIRLGDGVTPSYIDLSQGSIETPASTNTKWKGADDSINIELAPAGTCSLASNVFRANTPQKFTLSADSATDATWLTEAASFIGPWDWRNLATNADLVQITWSGAREVYLGTGAHSLLTIGSTAANGTGSAAANASGNGSLTDSTIDGTGAEYALKLGASVTAYTLTDCTLTAGTTGNMDKVYVAATTGTVTITISGTTSLVAGDVTSAGATVVIAAPELYQSVTISGLTSGSRVQIYDTTAATELANSTQASPGSNVTWASATAMTWTDPVAAATDRTIRVRIAYVSGTSAKGFIEASIGTCGITDGTEAVSYLANQVDDAVYNTNGIDGPSIYATSGITFTDSGSNDRINCNIGGGAVSWGTIYACFAYWMSTSTGIADDIAYVTAVDTANYLLDSLKIKNTSATPLTITGGWGRDATSLTIADCIDTAGSTGNIFPQPDHVVAYATGSGSLTAGDITNIWSNGSRTLTTTIPSASDNATAVVSAAVDGDVTLAESMRLQNSMLGGKVIGAGTGTEVFRSLADDKDRVTVTVDSVGNRSAVVRDLT